MAGRVEGKVAFVTGAARGQGRAHAVRLAQEGADIIAVDIAAGMEGPGRYYPAATQADLAVTVQEVEAAGGKIVAAVADVRDYDGLRQALDDGVAQLGRLDVVVANAGIWIFGALAHEVTERDWQDLIDVNLTGVWHTTKAATPHLIAQGTGGSIILTSSAAALKGGPRAVQYTVSKHALTGLMRTLALELAPHSIRVNTVNPGSVDTVMIQNEATWRLFVPDAEHPTRDQAAAVSATTHALPVPWVEASDVASAVLFLASDEARYVTGTTMVVDAGHTLL